MSSTNLSQRQIDLASPALSQHPPCPALSPPHDNSGSSERLNLFRYLLNLITQKRKLEAKTINPKTTPILHLSPELLRHIAGFLEPSDAVVLTLTCKAMLATVGNESWSLIKKSHWREKFLLVSLLKIDLPEKEVCPRCVSSRKAFRHSMMDYYMTGGEVYFRRRADGLVYLSTRPFPSKSPTLRSSESSSMSYLFNVPVKCIEPESVQTIHIRNLPHLVWYHHVLGWNFCRHGRLG